MTIKRRQNHRFKFESIKFGHYWLRSNGQLQTSANGATQLPRRLARLLAELAAAGGTAVSRLELLDRCWGKDSGSDASLSRAIADLRTIFRAHGEDAIESVYGLGYRLKLLDTDQGAGGKTHYNASFCREAWQRMYQRQIASLDAAESLFTLVTQEDEGNLQAWLGLAETQLQRMQLGYAPTIELWPPARIAVDRALALSPDCADALAYKGVGLTWAEWNFTEAEQYLADARQIDPKGYFPNQCSGWYSVSVGEFDMARQRFTDAIAANPAAAQAHGALALASMSGGDNEAALAIVRNLIQIDSHSPISQLSFALIEAAIGEPVSAVTAAERSVASLPESPLAKAILAYALTRAGRKHTARDVLDSQNQTGERIGFHTMAILAWVELGETACALESLQFGLATRCPWLLVMLHDPRLLPLHRERLFLELRQMAFGGR